MYEERPNAVLTFGDKKVEIPLDNVGNIAQYILEQAVKAPNFAKYELAKGLNDLHAVMRDWRPKEVPVDSDWTEITFDLRVLENAGNEIPNIFALIHDEKPRQCEFYGEVIDAARIVSVVSTIDDKVSVGTQTNLEFVAGTEGTRCMRAQWEAEYNGKEHLLSIAMNGQTGTVKFCRKGEVSQVTLAFRRTWIRTNVPVGKMMLTQQELTYLAENPDVRKELDRLIDQTGSEKPSVTGTESLFIDFVAAEGGNGVAVCQGAFCAPRSIRSITPKEINGAPLRHDLKIDDDPCWHPGVSVMQGEDQVLLIELVGDNTDIVQFVRKVWIENATFEVEYYPDPYRL